jgi:hypothetical protein
MSDRKHITGRQKIIGWYREAIKEYKEKLSSIDDLVAKYIRHIRTFSKRIDVLEKLDKKE